MNKTITRPIPTMLCPACKEADFNILRIKGSGVCLRCTHCDLLISLPDDQGNTRVIGSCTKEQGITLA